MPRLRPVALALLLAPGCTPSSGFEAPEPGRAFEVPDTPVEAACEVHPVSIEEASGLAKSALAAPGGPPLVVFLNKDGGTYSPGANDSARNRSSIVRSTRTMPPYDRGDARWSELVRCVQDLFAPFNITITDVEPTEGRYVETVVGGHPTDIGLSSGIGGIAPINTYSCRPIETAIAYVFPHNLGSDRNVCEVTAHEIGHTLSLEHEYLCEDPMTYLNGCGAKTFQNTEAWCGTYQAVQCDCRGGRQNTVAALLDLVGPASTEPPPPPTPDLGPPTAQILSPADGAYLSERTVVVIDAEVQDDLRVARVDLEWDFNGKSYGCPTSEQYVSCTRSGDRYTWRVQVGEGSRTFRVRTLDGVGNQVTTDPRTVILTPDGNPPPAPDAAPPIVTLLSPAEASTTPPSSSVVVEAEITDDRGIGAVALQWRFNQQRYGCPTSADYVSCEVTGDLYRWTVQVGVEGPRPFVVEATDDAGNTTTSPERTVRVATVIDAAPPQVTVLEPADGAALPERTEIVVSAAVTDETAVQDVALVWDYNGQTYPCPHASTYVGCALTDGVATWRLRVGVGTRRFTVRGTDAGGNQTVSAPRTITLVP